ncbi:PEGA domain-containing protein [Bradymonas sediminis]|uniref:Uncharacterized protein n=1 Tax=Bradymonas sediminis TaxID=1548548 RepID=A0A2Z4FQ88_9DELT|nr:PEGA domain-containing protein [Bradymonas sediminis]AWV91090.1 hypothetical protein DN745_17830 [Bradymonas sediminis]TDP75168.1 PEGA domain-containing protein [Bradymonas sediminis]
MYKKKMFFIQALVATLFLWGVSANIAFAQDNDEALNVAVLNLEGTGVDPQLLDTLTSVLRNEAQQFSSYDIVNQSPINLSEVAIVLGCSSDSLPCLGRAADQLDARVLIFGRVAKVEDTHRVTVVIFDAQSQKIVRQLVRTLASETKTSQGRSADPVSAFRKEVQSLFPRDANPVAENQATLLQIESNVDNTEIKLNGTMVGVAPIKRSSLPPGIYRIEASRQGYTTWKTNVELIAGADVRVWAPMKRAPGASDKVAAKAPVSGRKTVTPPPMPASSGPNWGAWSAIGVGGIALAGSGVMALMIFDTEDELKALDANRDPAPAKREAYLNDRQGLLDKGESYELGHRVLLGVGLVSVAAGVVWLVLDDGGEAQQRAQKIDDSNWDVGLSTRGVQAQWSW